MKFEEYKAYFESILANPSDYPTYTDPEYLNFTKLNWSRMNRWEKKFEPSAEAKAFFESINVPQKWTVITEPWCGDAAHSVPQLYALVKDNPNIDFEIQLRDTEPFLIDSYLTNGGKSIPKLIIRNELGEDVAVWGPRPDVLQQLFLEMKGNGVAMDSIKEAVQKWYNEDKGAEIQNELITLLKN